MKKSIKIQLNNSEINPQICVGDTVKLYDGLALTLVDDDELNTPQTRYVACAYPELTGSHQVLKDMQGEVIANGINNRFCTGIFGGSYQQDIIVRVGEALFRTNSRMVKLLA